MTVEDKKDAAAKTNSPVNIQRRDNVQDAADVGKVGNKVEEKAWERNDAPKGSTSESLLTTDESGKTVVADPTHYTHLANGRVVATYGIGTAHTDADYNDGQPVAVVTHFAG
jgi:hypothetical protein